MIKEAKNNQARIKGLKFRIRTKSTNGMRRWGEFGCKCVVVDGWIGRMDGANRSIDKI
jgi:hypothetical protein